MNPTTRRNTSLSRRDLLRMAFAAGTGAPFLLSGAAKARKSPSGRRESLAKARRPNVVVLLADDLGFAHSAGLR